MSLAINIEGEKIGVRSGKLWGGGGEEKRNLTKFVQISAMLQIRCLTALLFLFPLIITSGHWKLILELMLSLE